MADELSVKISMEKAIHSQLGDYVQGLWKKHGVCVENVSFRWMSDLRIGGSPGMRVTEIKTMMVTKKE